MGGRCHRVCTYEHSDFHYWSQVPSAGVVALHHQGPQLIRLPFYTVNSSLTICHVWNWYQSDPNSFWVVSKDGAESDWFWSIRSSCTKDYIWFSFLWQACFIAPWDPMDFKCWMLVLLSRKGHAHHLEIKWMDSAKECVPVPFSLPVIPRILLSLKP